MKATPATISDERVRRDTLRNSLREASTGRRRDRILALLVTAGAVGILVIVIAMAGSMLVESMPSFRASGLRFLVTSKWDPVSGEFGALPFLYGTIVSSLIAMLIGGPLALGTAIALSELVPGQVRGTLSALVELLAAIPSVVYGLWGIFVLAPILRSIVEPFLRTTLGFLPLFSGPPYGVGMLAGGLILAIMVVPTIAAVSRDVISVVPMDQREAMLAIGATRWETIWLAVLPYARTGIVGGAILGLGRALGETMAVTMLIGNRPEISASLFAPSYTLASVIANEFTEATNDLHLAALVEVGVVLFGVTLIVNGVARWLVWRIGQSGFRAVTATGTG